MAGKPRVKRVIEDLTLLAQAELAGESDTEPTAFDFVEHWHTNGSTMIQLAAKLQQASALDARGAYDPPLEGGSIARMLRRTYGEQAVDVMLARARARGAHALVETTHEIADEVVTSSEDASRARNRIGSRQWAATAYARDTFGNRAGAVNVQVNLGVMHLDALRHRAVPQQVTVSLDTQIQQAETLALPEDTDDVSDGVTST